jgi:hypothetical protein
MLGLGLRRIGLGLLGRRLARELTGIRSALDDQNRLLTRLADRFAPRPAAQSSEDIRTLTGVDHVDQVELGLVLDYIARTRATTGHEPTEDEILCYLADEKTTDLHARLTERAQETARMGRRDHS